VTAPLLHSPLGAPFGPSVRGDAAWPICCPAFRPWGASLASPAANLLCPLLTSADRSGRLPPPSVPRRDSRQISQGKTQTVSRVDAGVIQPTPLRMEDFAVIPPVAGLVPGVPPLVSGSCASPRAFGLGFLQTPPRGDALALLLAFGSAITWREDSHLARSVPCLAHTFALSGARSARPLQPLVICSLLDLRAGKLAIYTRLS